jgi:hypothetical protein
VVDSAAVLVGGKIDHLSKLNELMKDYAIGADVFFVLK